MEETYYLLKTPMVEMGYGNKVWFECIIDNKFIDYQNQESAGCGDEAMKIQIGGRVDVILGFSFDETTKASCKKMVQSKQKTVRRRATGRITDVTEEWKAIDLDLGKLSLASGIWASCRN